MIDEMMLQPWEDVDNVVDDDDIYQGLNQQPQVSAT